MIVSLCDYTGNMLKPWAEAGHNCIAVDIQHGIRNDTTVLFEGGGSITYTWGDIRSWCPPSRPDFLFAFPPCTDLAVSGARDFQRKAGYRLSDALELFDACLLAASYAGCPFMVENPVGRLSSHRRKPDYTFNPCDYAGYLKDPSEDAYTKRTCLGTGGGFRMPDPHPVEPDKGSMMHRMPPSDDRANLRSATPMGFARAVWLAN